EGIPPADLWATRTPDSITANMSLSDIESLVTQAEQSGGGWVQLVMHHICDGCDPTYAVSPSTLSAFLDWLQMRPQGTVVKTVNDMIGGAVQPPEAGPTAATTVSLTFDDNTSDQSQVRSMLSSHGMHGTLFVNSGTVGSTSSYLSWSQVSGFAADGNEIGGHTASHAHLSQVSTAEATRQV